MLRGAASKALDRVPAPVQGGSVSKPIKDLGPVITPGDVVYERLAWWPWPGVVTGDEKRGGSYWNPGDAFVRWWGTDSDRRVSLHALTTRKPHVLPALATLGVLAAAFCLGGWVL